ncbi:histone-lysine N-methyltransferase SETMAR-like [Calliopsis andreniformis]|uniref:histone-lysine N-methyltransferase SETMAR-like n=1 Tax=Calliopsis andreniformis TaxID=337506 RepID=UPI003FCD963E
MENQKMHLRHVMFHCFKKGNTSENTVKEICDIYRAQFITVPIVRNWFRRFRAGNFNLKDEDRSGRPSTTDIDLIKPYLNENPRSSVCEIANTSNIPRTTVHEHLTNLGYVNGYESVGPPSTDGKQSSEPNLDMRFTDSM